MKLTRLFAFIFQVENGHTAEVVTTLKGTTFRVAETSPDMYASIDSVADRLVSVQFLILFPCF